MIRKVLFAILLAHSALIAQGKPSRIILQAPPNPNPQVPAGPQIEPGNAPPPLIPPPQVPGQVPPTEIPPVELPPPQVPGTGAQIPPPQVPTDIPANPEVPPTELPPVELPPVTPATTVGASTGTTTAPATGTNPSGTTAAAGTTIAPVVVTPAPVTPVATTSVPTTPYPTTANPTTASPTTPAPTTAAPTLAPLPAGYEYGAWNQVCPLVPNEQDCYYNGQQIQSEAINNRGIVNCDRVADCCKCGSIQCGVVSPIAGLPPVEPHGCLQFSAGDYGAYGVKQVVVIGNPSTTIGASIDCVGKSGCQDMNLFGDSINNLMCNVDNSCSYATMQIDNPMDGFWIDCNGPESCKNAKITVNIGTPIPEGAMCNPQFMNIRRFGGVKCTAIGSCDGLELTINNRGCDSVIFDMFDLNAVTGAKFNLNGNINIDNCVCGPTCNFASGLGKCFQNLDRLICPDPRSCMNMIKTIINPMDMFYLECSNELSCALADLTIDLEQNPNDPQFAFQDPVRFIQTLKFGGINSGRGAVIHIHNHQLIDPQIPGMPVVVTIGLLECSALNSCQGLTIYTGDNVNIMHRICGSFEACNGCMIKKDELDVGIPCNPDPLAMYQQQPAIPQGPPQFIPQGPPQFVPAQQQPVQPQFVPIV